METITPKCEHFIVNRSENLMFRYQAWPTVCRDERSVLYAVASAMRLAHICPFGKTAMFMSFNEGKTWTKPIILNDTEMDDRDAGIIYLGDGKLLVSWFTHPAETYQNTYRASIEHGGRPYMEAAVKAVLDETYTMLPEEKRLGRSCIRVSEDYGVTWSEILTSPVSAPHGPSLMRDGSLLYLGKNWYGAAKELEPDAVGAYRSTDGGRTWQFASAVRLPAGLNWWNMDEPHVMDLGGGHLIGAVRSEGQKIPFGGTMYVIHSYDNGASWGDPICVGTPGYPPHLFRHSSGKIILTYGKRGEAPVGQRALVSEDGGMTWDKMYIINDRAPAPDYGDLGYPATTELADGSLYTVYYQKCEGDDFPSILGTRWEL